MVKSCDNHRTRETLYIVIGRRNASLNLRPVWVMIVWPFAVAWWYGVDTDHGTRQPTLEAKGPVGVLKTALQTRKKKTELIHIAQATRLDRGVQYCSSAYVDLSQQAVIKMSMCSSAEPNENSMAERLNRTLKEKFNLGNGLYRKRQLWRQFHRWLRPTIITVLIPNLTSKHPRNVIILDELKN